MTKASGLISGAYCRVSTARQEEQQTIDSQIDEIRARVEADGNILPKDNIYMDDGWTGEMLQRPGLDVMRDAAAEGKFEVLYVYDRGRLSRMFAYQEIILEELINKGVKFVTLHDVDAQTPEERVLQAMQGVFHEYERVKIAERMRRGKLYKARNGVIINGQAPYGYTYIAKNGNEPTKVVVNEEEAEVVRKIFHWVAVERVSLRVVRKRLFDLGISPRKNKQCIWTTGPLTRLLKNEVYVTGVVYYNKTEATVAKRSRSQVKYKKIKRTSRKARPKEDWIPYHVPIIVEESWMFEKIGQILTNNRIYAAKNKKYDYLLSGLIYCSCGSKRSGDGSNEYGHHYYRCAQRIYNFPLESKCRVQGVNAAVLDGLTWENLKNFMRDSEKLKEQAKSWILGQVEQDSATQSNKARLVKLIEGIKEEEFRYARAYGSEALDFEQFENLSKELKHKRLSYDLQLKELDAKIVGASIVEPEEVDKLCDYAQVVFKELDWADKKRVVHDIIDKIVIYDSGEVEVKGHLPEFNQNNQKLGQYYGYRNCGVTKCGEEHSF